VDIRNYQPKRRIHKGYQKDLKLNNKKNLQEIVIRWGWMPDYAATNSILTRVPVASAIFSRVLSVKPGREDHERPLDMGRGKEKEI